VPITKWPNVHRMVTMIRSTAVEDVRSHVKGVAMAHENLVRPWDEAKDKPTFDVEIHLNTGNITGLVVHKAQEAEGASLSVWQLLNKGTRIRYMMVSEDWVSKTSAGRTSSGAGSGFTTGLDFEDPRGGIEKREFAENIGRESKVSADSHVESGYKKGFKRAFG